MLSCAAECLQHRLARIALCHPDGCAVLVKPRPVLRVIVGLSS
jgi:hypothetical protein